MHVYISTGKIKYSSLLIYTIINGQQIERLIEAIHQNVSLKIIHAIKNCSCPFPKNYMYNVDIYVYFYKYVLYYVSFISKIASVPMEFPLSLMMRFIFVFFFYKVFAISSASHTRSWKKRSEAICCNWKHTRKAMSGVDEYSTLKKDKNK